MLAEHWDGKSWTIEPTPVVGDYKTKLAGVTTPSATRAWAVGHYYYNNTQWQTVIERRNGTNWKRQTTPNPSPTNNFLLGVDATSTSNAWAVGRYSLGAGNLTLTARSGESRRPAIPGRTTS
jgi:hypothetical protein